MLWEKNWILKLNKATNDVILIQNMYNKYQIYLINNQPKFNVLFRVFFANPKSEEKVPPVACDCWAAGF
jgi:hypothetical protein